MEKDKDNDNKLELAANGNGCNNGNTDPNTHTHIAHCAECWCIESERMDDFSGNILNRFINDITHYIDAGHVYRCENETTLAQNMRRASSW